MKKVLYIVFTSALLLICIAYYGRNVQLNSQGSKLKAFSSVDMEQSFIDKKIERRKKGYAKPDKPSKYVEYRQSLITGVVNNSYKRNYKIEELKSAVAHRASLKSTTAALPWVQRGPGNIGGRTRAIIVDPADVSHNTWFAAAVSGGIWKTVNAGGSWENISPDLPNLATVCLAMAPSNPDVIYAGTGEGFYNVDAVTGDGIFKSSDKGVTWTQIESTKGEDDFSFVNSIVISHLNENIIWAATNSGVYKSTDGGSSWGSSGIDMYNRYQKIVIHPSNADVLWLASNNVGIYKTENGGENWFLVHDMEGSERIEITVSPSNPDVLYAIDEDSKVYYSQDGGTEWAKAVESDDKTTEFLSGQGWYNSTLAVDPYDANKGFIGGLDIYKFQLGVEKSESTQAFAITNTISSLLHFEYLGGTYSNGGVQIFSGFSNTFNEVQIQFGEDKTQKAHLFTKKTTAAFTKIFQDDLSNLEYGNYLEVPFKVMNVSTGQQLHASFIDDNANGKFDVYEDGYEVILIHSTPYNESANNGGVESNNGDYRKLAAVYLQLNDGQSWDGSSLPDGNISINSYALKDRVLIPSKISTWSSTTSTNYSHADHHNITIVEGENSKFSMIVGNDGGVGYSNDKGVTWSSKSNGYVTSQFYGITRHPKQYKYFGGMQDNGSYYSDNNPNKLSAWNFALGGDGFDVIWHPRNTELMIGTYYYNQLQKSVNSGEDWYDIGSLIADNGEAEVAPFITRIASSLADPDLLFTGGASGLWKSSDFGISWKNIRMGSDWGFTKGSTPKIAISEANPDIVWAGVRMNAQSGFTKGKLHVSTDGGENFKPLDIIKNMGAITNILTHPTEPQTAYVLFSFSNFPKIFRTEDLGETWEDISGFGLEGSDESNNGFPNVIANTLLVMPFDTDQIWAGTEIGLFISNDKGASWTYADNGIPAVSIWDMKIVGDEVLMGTHGLGIWTVKMDELNNDIKNPYIKQIGINTKGDYILKTLFDSQLDSLEVYSDKGIIKTRYNVSVGEKTDTVYGDAETIEQLYMYGYLSGKRYPSNRKHLTVTSIFKPQHSYLNSFDKEEELNDFTGAQFSITKGIFSSNAIHSPHPYPENIDLYYTLKYPIIVSKEADLAFIQYHDIAFLETGNAGTAYPEEDFFDYVVVEGSKDGVNWKALSEGYDFTYHKPWSIDGVTYSSIPKSSDFVNHYINLYDAFEAEDTILVRFKLHSDPFEDGWGWVIDNLRIQGTISAVDDKVEIGFETKIYPNPVENDQVTVFVKDSYIGKFNIEVYSVSGQQVLNQSYFKGSDVHEQTVDLPHLSSGMYLVKVRMNNVVETLKIRVN